MEAFLPPPFARIEVTSDPFFAGEKLVGKKFSEVQAEVTKIGAQISQASDLPDE